MNQAEFKPGRLTQGNTCYRAGEVIYNIYERDCARVNNPWCIPDTEYHAAVYAEELENIILDFGGATLRLNGFLQPFTFYRCRQVVVKNVNIEYDRGIFSEAEVLEVTKEYARVHFSQSFPCRVENGRLIPYSTYWEDDHLFERQMFFQFFDAATGDAVSLSLGIVGPELPKGQDMCFHPTRYIAEQAGQDVIFRPAEKGEKMHEAWKAGTVLAIEHGGRLLSGILLQSCKNVTLENVRLINTVGMGIMPLHCENITVHGLRLMIDEHSHGIITNSADAIHGIANSGDFILEDSILENTLDDVLNIHGQFQKVKSCHENRLTVCLVSHELTQYVNPVDVGDEIAVYRENTMECRSTHRVTEKILLDKFTALLILDGVPEGVKPGDLVENLTGNCQLTLRRCRFGKTNTHLRFQTRGKITVEDCVTELPFWFTGDATFWYESSPCRDVTVQNTYFVTPKAVIGAYPEVRASEKEPYYHRHITVKNCMFVSQNPMEMRYTDDIRFIGNRNAQGKPMKLMLVNCGSALAPGCEIIRKSEEPYFDL